MDLTKFSGVIGYRDKSAGKMELYEIADQTDKQWLREMIDPRWLRLYLLVELGVPINVSKVARALRISRNKADRWLEQIEVRARKKTSMKPIRVNAMERLDYFINNHQNKQ